MYQYLYNKDLHHVILRSSPNIFHLKHDMDAELPKDLLATIVTISSLKVLFTNYKKLSFAWKVINLCGILLYVSICVEAVCSTSPAKGHHLQKI